MLSVSASSIQSYLTCPTQWYLGYIRKLRPRSFSKSMIRGEVAHAMIEEAMQAMYNMAPVRLQVCIEFVMTSVVPEIIAREKQAALFGELDLQAINAAIYAGVDIGIYFIDDVLPKLRWDVLAVEVPFKHRNKKSGYTIKGRVDALVKVDQMLYVVDHKVYGHMPDDDSLFLDLQLPFYLAMLRSDTTEFHTEDEIPSSLIEMLDDNENRPAIMQNILSSTPPVAPRVLKSGALSKDKSQRTTQGLYMQAMRDRGLDNDPSYLEFVATLNDSRYNKQITYAPTENHLEWSTALVDICAQEMLVCDHYNIPRPGHPMTCNMCSFKPICKTMREQGQTPDVVTYDKLLYCEKEKHHRGEIA